MKRISIYIIGALTLLLAGSVWFYYPTPPSTDVLDVVSYIVDPKQQQVSMHWKDTNGALYRNFENLEADIRQHNGELIFAMNAGIFQADLTPLGLFIDRGQTLHSINRAHGSGNFYLQPNGIFYLTKDRRAGVCKTEDYAGLEGVEYATQSGPMLVVDGDINSIFTKGSNNTNIRNGVGIRSNGEVVLAMSKDRVNFYDFANYFKSMGCTNALYLDGYVSETYFPAQSMSPRGGDFGVMIAVTK